MQKRIFIDENKGIDMQSTCGKKTGIGYYAKNLGWSAKKEVAAYKEKLEELKGSDPTSAEYSSAFRRVGFNQRVVDLYEDQQQGKNLTLPVELHSLRIGDVALCSNRFEYFLDFGIRIKARSPAEQTFVIQLTADNNGVGTYLPTERAVGGKRLRRRRVWQRSRSGRRTNDRWWNG